MKKIILTLVLLFTAVTEAKIIKLSKAQKNEIIKLQEVQKKKSTLKPTKKLTKKKIKPNKRIKTAKKYLGIRYKYGASTKTTKRFDCSSFVQRVYKDKKLPRTTRMQIKKGKKKSKRTASKGDLIFFGDSKNYVGHVGIIVDPKKKLMIHASSARGKVVISSYNTKYYKRKYRGVRSIG